MAPETTGEMETTMAATQLLNAKLSTEGIQGLEVRPTYHKPEDGEISVYKPGYVLLANEVVNKGDDPESVAETIFQAVLTANPAVADPESITG